MSMKASTIINVLNPPRVAANGNGMAFNSPALTIPLNNPFGRGAIVYITIANHTNDAALTVKWQHRDPVSGVGSDIAGATTTALTATGRLTVYPGITVAANADINNVLGPSLNLVLTPSGTAGANDVTVNVVFIA